MTDVIADLRRSRAGVGRPIATAGDLPGASLLNVRFE
jgi:hypothetical protein